MKAETNLLTLEPVADKATKFLKELGEEFLSAVDTGNVRQAVLIWETTDDRRHHISQCCPNCLEMFGMIERVKCSLQQKYWG